MDKDTIKRLIRESELMACSCGYCEEKVEALADKLAEEEEAQIGDGGENWVLPLRKSRTDNSEIVDDTGQHVFFVDGTFNEHGPRADFILKAVNNHAKMLRALRAIKEWSTGSAKWRLVAERHGIEQEYEAMSLYVDNLLREVDS